MARKRKQSDDEQAMQLSLFDIKSNPDEELSDEELEEDWEPDGDDEIGWETSDRTIEPQQRE